MKQNNPQISIIIPVYNEEAAIATILTYLKKNSNPSNIKEVLVVNGESSDQTASIAKKLDATVLHSPKGRARQMNLGAKHASGELLYFLHADTLPPQHFDMSILEAYHKGAKAGCFQMKFDSNSLFLNFFAWFSRFNHKMCRGGDQSLFITKKHFKKLNGFNEDYVVFEDNEFIGRIYKEGSFKVLSRPVKTSARRYEKRGAIALQYHFGVIHLKNYFGASPEQLYDYYKRKI